MSGIVGIARQGEISLVKSMLEKIAHRGHGRPHFVEQQHVTLGMLANSPASLRQLPSFPDRAVWDGYQPPLPFGKQVSLARDAFSLAAATPGGLFLARDALGIRPLYY